MPSEQAINAAEHILDDRKGADYYQDDTNLAKYLSGSLGLSDDEAIKVAKDINQDRNGSNYYQDEGKLSQYLSSKVKTEIHKSPFDKQYTVMIDTVPLPESTGDGINLGGESITTVIDQILRDAMTAAIGTWPQPEVSKTGKEEKSAFKKQYSVKIDTVPLPERSADRVNLVLQNVTPVISQIVSDAMSVAIGTWPTPEKPKTVKEEKGATV